jgi:hypothetical protein
MDDAPGPVRELTLHLYRAAVEKNDVWKDVRLLDLDAPWMLRKYPARHNVWLLGYAVPSLVRCYGIRASGAVLDAIALWLRQRKGRHVEIELPGRKEKALSARELKKALYTLHNYDEVSLVLDRGSRR